MKKRLCYCQFVADKELSRISTPVLGDNGKVRHGNAILSNGWYFLAYKEDGNFVMCYVCEGPDTALPVREPFLIEAKHVRLIDETNYYYETETGDLFEIKPFKTVSIHYGKETDKGDSGEEPMLYPDYQSNPWYVGVFHWMKAVLGYRAAVLFKKEFLTEEPDDVDKD